MQIVTTMSDSTVEELTAAFTSEPKIDQSLRQCNEPYIAWDFAKKKSFVASERDSPSGGVRREFCARLAG